MKYRLITETEPAFPVKDLVEITDNHNILRGAIFSQGTYEKNLESMDQFYSHPETKEKITFRPATTQESIRMSIPSFGEGKSYDIKRDIFDPRWLQARIVKTQDGIFTNTTETNEIKLKGFLDSAQKVNGIYIIDDERAFAPYESFEQEIQDAETFARFGLARALEHTPEKVAKNIKEIASHYKKGVNVWGFDPVDNPVMRVVSLTSDGSDGRLNVGGLSWDVNDGCAFGVLKEVPKALTIENK